MKRMKKISGLVSVLVLASLMITGCTTSKKAASTNTTKQDIETQQTQEAMTTANDSGDIIASGTVKNINWTISSDGLLYISGEGITLPDYFAMEELKKNRSAVKSVEFDTNIQTIGHGALSSMENLEKVTLPNSLMYVDQMAFVNCYKLKELILPEEGGFAADTAGWLTNCPIETITIPGGMKSVPNCIGGEALKSVTIEEGVKIISRDAFANSSNLTEITLPQSLEEIENGSFCWCSSLKSVIIPDSVTKIGEALFVGCESLEMVHMPSGLETFSSDMIDYNLNNSRISVKKIELPTGCTVEDDYYKDVIVFY